MVLVKDTEHILPERTEVRGKEMGPVAVVAELCTVTDAEGSGLCRVQGL